MKSLARFVIVLALVCLGCSGADDRPPPFRGSEEPDTALATSSANAPAPCEDGDVKSCKVTLPRHDGIESCWTGVRLCAGGAWSECGDEEVLWKKYFSES